MRDVADIEVGAIVMAGGRSERMRAGGSADHKSLRTVRGAPLIEWNLRALLDCGFRRLFVAFNAREHALAEWLADRGLTLCRQHSSALQLLVEDEPLGTIGAVRLLPADVQNAVVVNVDNLTTLDLGELLRTHVEKGAAATIATHTHAFRMPFGMLEVQGQRVTAYREKPELPVVISSGTYALHRRAIVRVPAGRRSDVPALIASLLEDGEVVAAHPHREPWIDVNDEAALVQAEELFGSLHAERAAS
ncbi:MAG: sugar phosphate nucleotidyltransferase [Deltaproteobacteria bacterium]